MPALTLPQNIKDMLGSLPDFRFVKMWKYLFLCFQLRNSDVVFPRIESLLQKSTKKADQLATDIMFGLVKASSSFGYEDQLAVRQFFLRIFDLYLPKLSADNKHAWHGLFVDFFLNRDLRRYKWLFDYMLTNIFDESKSMFHQAEYLNLTSEAAIDNWKYPQISAKLLATIEPKLGHQFKLIRDSLAK